MNKSKSGKNDLRIDGTRTSLKEVGTKVGRWTMGVLFDTSGTPAAIIKEFLPFFFGTLADVAIGQVLAGNPEVLVCG